MDLVGIPEGWFWMGRDDGPAAEAPRHRVWVDRFEIAPHPVTNADYAASFVDEGLQGHAARGLAVVTCMDSRIDPLRMLGLAKGDAKIMRNAGGR